MNDSTLKAMVSARNNVNKALWEVAPYIFKVVKPWVGQKVILANGELSQKFSRDLIPLPSRPELRAHYSANHGYTFKVHFSAGVSIPDSHTVYAESVLYVANLRDGILASMVDYPPSSQFRTDYTFEEIRGLEKQINAARDTLSNLQSKMTVFI